MPEFNSFIQKFPPETRATLTSLWSSLSTEEKTSIQSLVNGLPSDANMLRTLVQMAAVQVKVAFGNKHRVAIVGPANVGKSTLFNQLIQQKTDQAAVGPLPGTTRNNQTADAGLFIIVDTPGADAVGDVGEQERIEALSAASEADFLIVLFDAIQGVKQTELDLYQRVLSLNKPYVIVINKIDLVKQHKKDVIAAAARNLKLESDQIIAVTAKDGKNIDQLIAAIAAAEPEMVAALGQALPQYRAQLSWRTIIGAASASAVIALTPLPIIDFVPLIAVQAVMVLGIARIYNYEMTLARAREMIAAFGLGMLGRTLFTELSKLGGIPGWMLGSAIASGITVAMGYAATVWFEKGEKISSDSFNHISRGITQYVLETIRGLGIRKPTSKSLQEHIEAALKSAQIKEIELTDSKAAQIEKKETPQ